MSKLKIAQACFRELTLLALIIAGTFEYHKGRFESSHYWILLAIFLQLIRMNAKKE